MRAEGEVLADELDAEIKSLVATLEPLSDEQWRRTAATDGWPVGLVAFHIALGLERQAGWIEQALEGGPPHEFSWDVTNQMNAALDIRVHAHGLVTVAAGCTGMVPSSFVRSRALVTREPQ